MNIFISILVILFLLAVMKEDIKNIRKLIISEKKGTFEIILYIATIAVFIMITVIYGKSLIHYIVGTVAIAFIIVEFLKQGIFNEGIVALERGRGIHKWGEISKVEIKKGKNIKVTYVVKNGVDLIHKFSLDDYKKIIDIFISNGVEYEINYN